MNNCLRSRAQCYPHVGEGLLLSTLQSYLEKNTPFKRLYVGYSGGLDSTVLLHLLTQISYLSSHLTAIHVHHGLSEHADSWQKHCEHTCAQWQIPLEVKRIQCKQRANQEAAARKARYQVFDEYVGEGEALILAHHEDDQAETVLLQLSRGAGTAGLSGMWPEKRRGCYTLLRPLLNQTKASLLAYAKAHNLSWIEDESNQQLNFSRNHIRYTILPQLASRWPAVKTQLANFASLSQQASENLFDLACLDCPSLAGPSTELDLHSLMPLNQARLANVLWFWLKQQGVSPLNMLMVQRVLNELVYAAESTGLRVSFAQHAIGCYRRTLYLVPMSMDLPLSSVSWENFPEPLVLPHPLGQLKVREALLGEYGVFIEGAVEVRFREGGESLYWRGQRKSLKKCFQTWGVPEWKRATLPLIYINGELAKVVGHAVSDRFVVQSSGKVIMWEPMNA